MTGPNAADLERDPREAETPDDICVCGDYRKHHRTDGRCLFNRHGFGNVGHGGAPDCDEFRLSHQLLKEAECHD